MGAPAAHALPAERVAHILESDLDTGLAGAEAAARLETFGLNRPQVASRPRYLVLVLHQVVDPLVLLLLVATAVSVAIGDVVEGSAIAAVLVLNGILGFWQEAGAERAILSLSKTFTQYANVVRDGAVVAIDAEAVVPGDLILLGEGDRVPADARVATTRVLDVDESVLTGESLPVAKSPRPVSPTTPLAERQSMVYAGSAVTRGGGTALVCATGPETELGRIELLAGRAKAPTTPLARRLGVLARQMVVVGIGVTVLLAAAMVAQGEAAHEAFLVGVAVAVAAVPEGLAATVTAALALGARAMARRGAIVRQLEAIETLGETTVICTDKTGTLTENRVRVAALKSARGVDERRLLTAAVLASSGRATSSGVGDPLEQALLHAAMERGLGRDRLLAGRRLVDELPFDSERKRMTVVYEEQGTHRAYMKGAPEVIEDRCPPDASLGAVVRNWAADGLRVLAVSTRPVEPDAVDVEEGHTLLGVIALHDPLRETAASAVARARASGIEIRMLTGDHPATAATIGRALGLADDAVVARATPADKLGLVQKLQAGGDVVAVTGDGVNDAPALRQADVGVAMGRSGTEAAREAAAIVLTDDDFSTIVAAVEEGRRIADNIRTFVAFLVSANLGEVLVFAVAVVAGLGTPLAVVQVLVVNLVTDGLPAFALARDPASTRTMTTPPRTGTQLFSGTIWLGLCAVAVTVGAVTLAAFGAGLALGDGVAQTMTFATLALSELALVFAVRCPLAHAWRAPRNRWLGWSVAASVAVVAAAVYVPWAHEPFATCSLDPVEATLCLAFALAPFAVMELAKSLWSWRGRAVFFGAATTPGLQS